MKSKNRPSPPFAAGFGSDCAGCGVEIEAGDEITMWQGEAYHYDENCCPQLRVQREHERKEQEDPWE